MREAFPIVRQPAPGASAPIVVSVPHYGTEALPQVTREDYCEPRFETFAYGFADTFACDLYGDLHRHGATVLATPVSRMFVDVNRRRDDFEQRDGAVCSKRGVVRTHTMRDVAIFARPLMPAELEARLCALYDPYYATLDRLLADVRAAHGYAILLDAHTGSPRRMGDHEVILGTCRASTCGPALTRTVAAIFSRHGFRVADNVSGYTGGNIVATYGRPHAGVHALQLEINAALLMTTSREELIALITRGGVPDRAETTITRLHECLRETLAALPAAVTAEKDDS
jgi:N-formylglutamate deformylase